MVFLSQLPPIISLAALSYLAKQSPETAGSRRDVTSDHEIQDTCRAGKTSGKEGSLLIVPLVPEINGQLERFFSVREFHENPMLAIMHF